MPRPVPIPVRLAFRKRWREGQPVIQFAGELGLPVRTARSRIALLGSGDDAAVAPAYHTGPGPRSAERQALLDATLDLRREHPRWGPSSSASNSAGWGTSPPRPAPCSAGSAAPAWAPPPPAARRGATTPAPSRRTTSGGWTPASPWP